MPTIDSSLLPEAITADVTLGHVVHSIDVWREFNADVYANTVNVMSTEYGAIDGGSAATNTAALNAARADIVATGKLGAIYIPLGVNLPVDAEGVIGDSDVAYIGGGTISTTDTATQEDPGHLITFPADSSGWAVRDIRFEAPDNSIVAIKATSCRDFAVEDCHASGCTLIRTNADIATYATIDTDPETGNVCRDFVIRNNTLTATTDETNLAAILLLYCFDGRISGNRITDHHQGIQWWGGNANPGDDGALANERKCGRLNIANNLVTGSLEGGIWGSMADQVTITGNTVDGAGDLAIDLEGCTHSTVSGNTVRDGQNGGLATFFECYDVAFTGNTVTTNVLNGRLMRVQNGSGLPTVLSIRFTGNSFACLNGVGFVHIETARDATFSNNTLDNCTIHTKTNNQRNTTLENNTQTFTVIADYAIKAIEAGFNNLNGKLFIRHNTIQSTVTQLAGSRGIFVDQFDGDNPPLTIIEGNEVSTGFTASIESRWAGPSGIAPGKYLIRNNLTPVAVLNTEAGVLPSITVEEGNRNSTTLDLWP